MAADVSSPKNDTPKRKCPGCGKLITDYRCKACWKKMLRENEYSSPAEGKCGVVKSGRRFH